MTRNPLRPRTLALTALAALAACSTPASIVADKPAEISVVLTSAPPNAADARLPISFDANKAQTYGVDLQVIDLDGSVRKSFTGTDAWVRLSVNPGTILGTEGPGGPSDPNVAGPNIHLVDGVARGIKVKVGSAYGNARLIARDVGYVPAPAGKVAQCADGLDNDGNGYADYPNDPGCFFLNDDTESPPTGAYGTSPPIYYAFPRIHDIQGPSSTPFNGKQVELPGTDPVHLVVSALTKDGMYVTDVEDDLGPHDPRFNSLFIYNFNPPPEIHVCDRLTRLTGNVSVFFGSIQMGTAAWSKKPWLNPDLSGPCPVPDYFTVDDAFSAVPANMQGVQGRLIRIVSPVIGTHFGPNTAPAGIPSDGASNCDLNGDGIAGCLTSKAGYRAEESACCKACDGDADCTEWNDWLSHSQVKVKFGPSNATLYAKFSQVANFTPKDYVGPGKFAELRGVVTTFTLPAPLPSFAIAPRCRDDVVLTSDDPSTNRDVAHACVCYRTDEFGECVF